MKKVMEIIRECEKIIGVKVDVPVKISGRLKKTYGQVQSLVTLRMGRVVNVEPVNIKISRGVIEEASKEDIEQIIRHEYAHFACYKTHGDHDHDTKAFRIICEKLNTSPNPTISLEKRPTFKYEVDCKCCGKNLASYTNSRADIVKTDGKGYKSLCCKAEVLVKKMY